MPTQPTWRNRLADAGMHAADFIARLGLLPIANLIANASLRLRRE